MNIRSGIETTILLRNNAPLDDFLGLSANDMQHLLYDTFGDKSPVQLRNDIDNATLDRIPFFRLTEEFLKLLQRDKQIKLTPLGALPKKVMVELYAYKFIPAEHIERGITKLSREIDCNSIMTARFVIELAGLVKKQYGRLYLTKAGATLLQPDKRLQLFKTIFSSFIDKFSWSYNDGYPEHPIGQLGWAFSILLLDKFGDQPRTIGLYADKYLTAFPKFLSFFNPNFFAPKRQFQQCYGIRTFERFFLWFGFATVDKQKVFLDLDTDKFTATDLVQKLFNIERT